MRDARLQLWGAVGSSFRFWDDLVSLQIKLSRLSQPSAKSLIQRAAMLARLGEHALAKRDITFARSIDPSDPEVQAVHCRLEMYDRPADSQYPEPSVHDCALELLASPFANRAERKMALVAIDPRRLPILVRCGLPTTERLTLVQRSGDQIELAGVDTWDLPEAVGKANVARTAISALDYFVLRPLKGSRTVAAKINGRLETLSVAAPIASQGSTSRMPTETARLWIILPVKDGGDVLYRCLKTVRTAYDNLQDCRLIIVDDCSETAESRACLSELSRLPGVTLLRTQQTLGFTGAVNFGLQAVGRGPVLLLNSDTWLPRHTLPRLLAHLDDPEVGTVTPLSNNAGSVSLCGPGRPCALPPPMICERLANIAYKLHRGLAVDLPSGNGFCMLISESCLRAVGPLSRQYESGYYEEVDFCLRASLLGFRHVAAADCFVGHVGSASYGTDKLRLVASNRRRLHQRFPGYSALFGGFVSLDPLAAICQSLIAEVASAWSPKMIETGIQSPEWKSLTLPVYPYGPLLVTCNDPELPGALRRKRIGRLRLVGEAELAAAGLRLLPDSRFRATWCARNDVLTFHTNSGERRFHLSYADGSVNSSGSLEAAALAMYTDLARIEASQ